MNFEQTIQKKDWHPADIIAALRKRNTSLAAISRAAGLSSSTLSNALSRPWPKGELIIAAAIGIPASEIWPSRYFDPQGKLITRQIRSTTKRTEKNFN